jgi:hypothetical protein
LLDLTLSGTGLRKTSDEAAGGVAAAIGAPSRGGSGYCDFLGKGASPGPAAKHGRRKSSLSGAPPAAGSPAALRPARLAAPLGRRAAGAGAAARSRGAA